LKPAPAPVVPTKVAVEINAESLGLFDTEAHKTTTPTTPTTPSDNNDASTTGTIGQPLVTKKTRSCCEVVTQFVVSTNHST
jgi:hypothetical protein